MMKTAQERAEYYRKSDEYYCHCLARVSWHYHQLSHWEFEMRRHLPQGMHYREITYDPATDPTLRPHSDDPYVIARDAAADHARDDNDDLVAPEDPVNVALTMDRAVRNTIGRSRGNVGGNRGQGVAPPVRECSFTGYMKCNPTSFYGNKGDVELCRWFEKTESMFSISKCAGRNKKKKIEAYIRGLSENVKWETTSSKPATLNEAVRMAHTLIEQKLQAKNERVAEGNKRRRENSQGSNRNNHNNNQGNYRDNSRHPHYNNQRQRNARAMTTAQNEGVDQGGPATKCNSCGICHFGQCPPKCNKCRKIGHKVRDYKGKAIATVVRDAVIVYGKKVVHISVKNKTLVVGGDKAVVKRSGDVTRLQALVDKKRIVITEEIIREILQFNDAEGQRFNFSKYIFESLVRNVDISSKFYMYPRVGKGFSGVETPLFETMLVVRDIAAEEEVQVLDKCSALVLRVDGLENANAAQQLEIVTLKARVKKLEKLNKVKSSKLRRLKKVGTSQRVKSSSDVENVFNQGRMSVDMETNEGLELVVDQEKDVEIEGRKADKQAEIYNIDLDHSSKVLSMQEDDTEVQEVVEIVTTAKLITEVVTAAAATQVVAASTPIPAAKPKVLKIAAAPAVSTRRRKGVNVALDHVQAKEPQYIKRYHRIKKKPQSKFEARKNMISYLKNTEGFKMEFFKGKTYDQILLIFQARFDANLKFLFKSREEMEKEDEKIIKSINETPAHKAAKRRKLSEEAQEADDLKKRLEIVQDENDDVFVEAIQLAQKVPVMDYQVVVIDNKPKPLLSLVAVEFDVFLPLLISHSILLFTVSASTPNRSIGFDIPIWVQLFLLVERRYPLSRFTLEQFVNVARLQLLELMLLKRSKENTKCVSAASEELTAAKHKLMLLI
nr:hypothetical protein [Tanacetum cinerariifolium]